VFPVRAPTTFGTPPLFVAAAGKLAKRISLHLRIADGFERLRREVDLIVVLTVREDAQLAQILNQPVGLVMGRSRPPA
jgi:hypothetical protein